MTLPSPTVGSRWRAASAAFTVEEAEGSNSGGDSIERLARCTDGLRGCCYICSSFTDRHPVSPPLSALHSCPWHLIECTHEAATCIDVQAVGLRTQANVCLTGLEDSVDTVQFELTSQPLIIFV